jgi:hypothetical protein
MKEVIASRVPEEGIQERVHNLEEQVASLREDLAWLSSRSARGDVELLATENESSMPKEASTAEAAKLLGVGKDTVLGQISSPRKLITPRECHRDRFQGKISLRQVYDLFYGSELDGFRVGRKVLLYDDSVDSYIERNRNEKTTTQDQGPEQRVVAEPIRRKGKPQHRQQHEFQFFHLPEGH